MKDPTPHLSGERKVDAASFGVEFAELTLGLLEARLFGLFVRGASGYLTERLERLGAMATSAKVCGPASPDRLLCRCIVALPTLMPDPEEAVQPELASAPADPQTFDRLKGALPDGVVTALLYGSRSEGGLTPFSDVDTLLVFDDESLCGPARLASTAVTCAPFVRETLRTDPLQHHTPYVVPASLLERYPAFRIPPEALDGASALKGVAPKLLPVRSREKSRQRLATYREKFERLVRSKAARPRTWYGIKQSLSQVMLAPALTLEAAGERTSKAGSFNRAKPLLGDAYRALESATQARAKWRAPSFRLFRRALGLPLNPWRLQAALVKRTKRKPLPQSFFADALRLFQKAGEAAR